MWTTERLPIKRLDVNFDLAVRKLQEDAKAKGLWKGTPAAGDRADIWTAGVLAYFDAAGAGFAPNDATRPITTREALKEYDPELYKLVDGDDAIPNMSIGGISVDGRCIILRAVRLCRSVVLTFKNVNWTTK